MIHGLFQIKICFNSFRKNQDSQASCSFLFYMLHHVARNMDEFHSYPTWMFGVLAPMPPVKMKAKHLCGKRWEVVDASCAIWATFQHAAGVDSVQSVCWSRAAWQAHWQGQGKKNESWKVLKNPVNPNVGWRFRVCRIERYHVLAHVSTILSPKYFTHCL